MLFNGLLAEQDIEGDVLVLRHTPAHRDGELKVFLPTIAAEQPELFNAYQQTQNKAVEGKMLKAKYVASFIGLEKQQAVFGTFCQLCLRDGHVSGGAARGIRTPDPIITNDVLYRLSYCGPGAVITPGWGHCKQGLELSADRRRGRETSRTASATSLPVSAQAWCPRLRSRATGWRPRFTAGAPTCTIPVCAAGCTGCGCRP